MTEVPEEVLEEIFYESTPVKVSVCSECEADPKKFAHTDEFLYLVSGDVVTGEWLCGYHRWKKTL